MLQPEVVFCGKSLYISGLASGIQKEKQLRVIRLESAFNQITEDLKMLCPDIVIFELDSENPEEAVRDFLKAYPHTGLIGLTPDDDSLTVFSGELHYKTHIDELGAVIMDKNIFQCVRPKGSLK